MLLLKVIILMIKISKECKKCKCICKVTEELRKQWCAIGKSFMKGNPVGNDAEDKSQ